ncbi:hypothetical protein ABXV18_24410 [Vibrio owensii]|uniref:hypothetical protein n=1 Tax=Vibrio owensii TaxID=696485 RepID=UPI003393F6E4
MSIVNLAIRHKFMQPCTGCDESSPLFFSLFNEPQDSDKILKGSSVDLDVLKSIDATDTNKVCLFFDDYLTSEFANSFLFNVSSFGQTTYPGGYIKLETIEGRVLEEHSFFLPNARDFDYLITKWESEFPDGKPLKGHAYLRHEDKDYIFFGIYSDFEELYRVTVRKPDGSEVVIVRDLKPTPKTYYDVSCAYSVVNSDSDIVSVEVDRFVFEGDDADSKAKAKYDELVGEMTTPILGDVFAVSLMKGDHLHNQPGSKTLVNDINTSNSKNIISLPTKTKNFESIKSKLVSDLATELGKGSTYPIEFEVPFDVEDVGKSSHLTVSFNKIYSIIFTASSA